MRRRYLKKKNLDEALNLFFGSFETRRLTNSETIPTPESLGRVTAEPAFAKISSPHYHCSAMDGIAVRAVDTFGASASTPVRLSAEQFDFVDTGDAIPADYDAVIMIEDVREIDNGVEIRSAARPWQNIRMVGEDVVATQMLLPRAHKIKPADLAIMLSCGVQSVSVKVNPSVAIFPTGTELVDAMSNQLEDLEVGKIIESNSHLIAGLVREYGGIPERFEPVEDSPDAIREKILKASSEYDIVVINAGTSAGREDYVPQVIEELGGLLVHGIDVMPGKPLSLGIVNDKPIIGVPGYPVSAFIVCELFLKPLICRLLGLPTPVRDSIEGVMGRRVTSKLGVEEFLRINASYINNQLVAVPLGRGASLLNSVTRADGFVRIPSTSEGIEKGEKISIELLKSKSKIKNNVLIIGSHDIVLDLIADMIKVENSETTIVSAHVGSLGGLNALKRGECHMAGIHLLDEETGEYNVPYVKRLFNEKIRLINLTYRQQGLIVPKGNPKEIRSLEDLCDKDVVFVNRQRGSGTRILLDDKLSELGFDKDEIIGYDRELYTHLAVAVAVSSEAADVGLGISSVAQTLGLDFIPVAEERYDLAIPPEYLELPAIKRIIDLISSSDFKKRVKALGGYDTRDTGKSFL